MRRKGSDEKHFDSVVKKAFGDFVIKSAYNGHELMLALRARFPDFQWSSVITESSIIDAYVAPFKELVDDTSLFLSVDDDDDEESREGFSCNETVC